MLTAVSTVLDAFGGASGPRDEDVLVNYAHALSASAPLELKDLEQTARALNLYTNLGDAEGQAQACDALCERVRAGKLPAGSIDEGAVEGELKANAGFPEPELVLQCGPEEHLGGLLPWHCRVTQYAHLGPLGAVSEACARRALVEHAGVTQRHGR